MRKVEFIYDADCPHVESTRQRLLQAFQNLGKDPVWEEWDRSLSTSPAHVRLYGSPTILVNGVDVTGAAPSDGGNCCRVYRTQQGELQGVPPIETLTAALRIDSGNGTGRTRSFFMVIPAVGVAMLPNLACPACWPAYAGLLGSMGLGFLTRTAYLLPLTVGFLILAVGALGYRARSRYGFGPFITGLVAATVVMIGKFQFESDATMYAGLALLVGASVWNTWPRPSQRTACSACVEREMTDEVQLS